MSDKHSNITIFSDSSLALTNKIKDRVKLLPLYVYFDNNRVYNEIDGLERNQFFTMLEKEQAYTSGCNPADVEELLKNEVTKGNDVLVFSVSSGLSSTYNTIRLVAEELNEESIEIGRNNKIRVIDTKSISAGISFLVEKAFELIDNNETIDNIFDIITNEIDKIELYFIVDDLKYLARGGRINKSIAAIGDVLNIKPVLTFNKDGKIELLNKVRGLKMGIDHLVKAADKQTNKRVVVARANNNDVCNRLIAKSGVEETVDLDLVISSHTGPNAAAIVVYRE